MIKRILKLICLLFVLEGTLCTISYATEYSTLEVEAAQSTLNKNWDKSIELYTQLIDNNPQEDLYLEARGYAYANKCVKTSILNNCYMALNDLNKYLFYSYNDIKFFAAYYTRGLVNLKLKNYDSALSDLTKAINISGQNPKARAAAYFTRGSVKLIINKYNDSGYSDIETAKNISPEIVTLMEKRMVEVATCNKLIPEERTACYNKIKSIDTIISSTAEQTSYIQEDFDRYKEEKTDAPTSVNEWSKLPASGEDNNSYLQRKYEQGISAARYLTGSDDVSIYDTVELPETPPDELTGSNMSELLTADPEWNQRQRRYAAISKAITVTSDKASKAGFGLIIVISILLIGLFLNINPKKSYNDSIPYEKQDALKKIFTDCINDVKNHLPYNIKSGTLQEQIFLSEVIFCITCLGLMYPVMTKQVSYSDKKNISIGHFAIQIVQSFLNNNIISRETLRKYYGTRILIYSGQIKKIIRQLELYGINYDMERHIDNAFLATIEWVLYRLYYEDITNFNAYNPLKASLNDMVYTHRINTQVDEFVYDINRAMLDFSDVIKVL